MIIQRKKQSNDSSGRQQVKQEQGNYNLVDCSPSLLKPYFLLVAIQNSVSKFLA